MISDPIRTADGSFTLRHPERGETYHAHEGARSEAHSKFIVPARLRERLSRGPVRLLDVGFGLGINCREALHTAGIGPLHIDSVELEPEALERALTLDPDDPLLLDLKKQHREHVHANRRVHLHFGDLRDLLPRLPGPYDLIFHDPFSPLKNTECWTVELFIQLRERLKADGVLLTYSESGVVRAALQHAEFLIGATPAVPPHRGGTIATLPPFPPDAPLPPQSHLPYREPHPHATAKEIRSAREALVRMQFDQPGQRS
jgi:tRNA U34 5-methylaminomethyl-2-thiouridine-forming methyltransferase MnmC